MPSGRSPEAPAWLAKPWTTLAVIAVISITIVTYMSVRGGLRDAEERRLAEAWWHASQPITGTLLAYVVLLQARDQPLIAWPVAVLCVAQDVPLYGTPLPFQISMASLLIGSFICCALVNLRGATTFFCLLGLLGAVAHLAAGGCVESFGLLPEPVRAPASF